MQLPAICKEIVLVPYFILAKQSLFCPNTSLLAFQEGVMILHDQASFRLKVYGPAVFFFSANVNLSL